MSVPNHQSIVAALYARGGHTLTTKEGAGRFTEAAASALHFVDRSWGHLRKPAGRTHVVDAQGNRHAVDVVLYRATGAIVDIIRDAGGPGAGLSWGVGADGEYGMDDWYAPSGDVPALPTVPTPIPAQAPAPSQVQCQAQACRFEAVPEPPWQDIAALLREINGKLDRVLNQQERAYVGAVGYRLRLTPEK